MTQTLTAGDDTPPHRRAARPHPPSLPVRRAAPSSGSTRPPALLALIPHLLGFGPEASIVLIGLAPPRDRVRVTLRYDLPDPPDADLAADIAAHARRRPQLQRLTAAVAVGYGPEALVTPVADALRDAAARAGIDLRDFLRVEDGRYWSYTCGDEACCPAAGSRST